jgi:hypothetical protein
VINGGSNPSTAVVKHRVIFKADAGMEKEDHGKIKRTKMRRTNSTGVNI